MTPGTNRNSSVVPHGREGQPIPYGITFPNYKSEIVDKRVICSWSVIHWSRWPNLIKAEHGRKYDMGFVGDATNLHALKLFLQRTTGYWIPFHVLIVLGMKYAFRKLIYRGWQESLVSSSIWKSGRTCYSNPIAVIEALGHTFPTKRYDAR